MPQVEWAGAALSSAFGRLRAPSAGGDVRRPAERRARACIGDKSRPVDQGWNGQSLIRFVKDGKTVSAMCVEIDRVAQAVTDVVILVEGDDLRLQRGDLHHVQVDGVADMIWSSGWQVQAAALFRMRHRRRSRYQ